MGCISSKILVRSGSLREKVSHGLERRRRSNLVEEIILSGSKSSGDKFLALLRTSSSAARRSKDATADSEQNTATTAADKIEIIDVSELLAGLEEEDEEERQDGQEDGGGKSSPQCASDSAAGRATSFRTVEEFDALLIQCGSPEQAKTDIVVAIAPEPEHGATVVPLLPPPQSDSSGKEEPTTAAAETASNQDAAEQGDAGGASEQGDDAATVTDQSSASEQGDAGGAKWRARARKLGELRLSAPGAFHFSKSGSLRDWLLGGGQTFSSGSYVTPRFGAVEPPPSEHGDHPPGEQKQEVAVFDPELVAQFDLAMEELTVDEERVLREVLEVLEAGEKKETERLERLNDQQLVSVPVQNISSA